MLALAAPSVAQKPPTGHGLQTVAPIPELKLPIGQALQLELPETFANCPGLHGTHAAPVECASVPLAQVAQRCASHVRELSVRVTADTNLVPGTSAQAWHTSVPMPRRPNWPPSQPEHENVQVSDPSMLPSE